AAVFAGEASILRAGVVSSSVDTGGGPEGPRPRRGPSTSSWATAPSPSPAHEDGIRLVRQARVRAAVVRVNHSRHMRVVRAPSVDSHRTPEAIRPGAHRGDLGIRSWTLPEDRHRPVQPTLSGGRPDR